MQEAGAEGRACVREGSANTSSADTRPHHTGARTLPGLSWDSRGVLLKALACNPHIADLTQGDRTGRLAEVRRGSMNGAQRGNPTQPPCQDNTRTYCRYGELPSASGMSHCLLVNPTRHGPYLNEIHDRKWTQVKGNLTRILS